MLLPYNLSVFINHLIMNKHTLCWINLNASKVPYNFNGCQSKGQFYVVSGGGRVGCTVILCSVADETSLVVFGDEQVITEPRSLLNKFMKQVEGDSV